MNEVAPHILLSPEQPELKPLCVVSVDEVADDTPVTPASIELRPLCPVSVDEVADDTPVTPERIEPKGASIGDLRPSNPRVEVRARYLDSSSGSCHDFCKYGHKNVKESISTFIAHKKKVLANSKLLSEPNRKTPNQPRVAIKTVDGVPKLTLSPPKSTINGSSSLSTPVAKSDKKINDVILRKGVGVMQVSPTQGLLSKGKKKVSVAANARISSEPSVRRALTGKSQIGKNPKEVPHLKKHISVGKCETKQPLNAKISQEKKLGSDGNKTQSAGQTPCFENKKGKQKSPDVVTPRSSLISRKISSGLKRDQNVLSKAMKSHDGISISERSGIKTQNQMPQRKVELVSWPKRVVKKVGLEEKNDSTHKLGFRRGQIVDSEKSNTAPRRLKFKPRKAMVGDLNHKNDDSENSKTESAKPMTNHKVGVNARLKRVGKVGIEGKNENSAHKLNFERGKTIAIQPNNTAPRRLKFKQRKVMVENINGDYNRRNLKKVVGVDAMKGSNPEHLRVVLKHQDVEGKKDVQSLLNNVIEETASRLVRLRKSKVKALVGAFESLMSLPDAKSSTTGAS